MSDLKIEGKLVNNEKRIQNHARKTPPAHKFESKSRHPFLCISKAKTPLLSPALPPDQVSEPHYVNNFGLFEVICMCPSTNRILPRVTHLCVTHP